MSFQTLLFILPHSCIFLIWITNKPCSLVHYVNLYNRLCTPCVARYNAFIGKPQIETDFPLLQSMTALATTLSASIIVIFFRRLILDASPYALARKGVFTGPGQTAMTRIPRSANSLFNALLKEYT